jgi:hypothetical protein
MRVTRQAKSPHVVNEQFGRIEFSATREPVGPFLPMRYAGRLSIASTHVLRRGDYRQPGELVEPDPAVIETDRYRQFPTRGWRLTLAKWIASPEKNGLGDHTTDAAHSISLQERLITVIVP